MIQFQDKFIVRFSWFLMFFIALQPVLDVLTSISILYYESTVTVGIIVRVLVMLFALIYIFCWQHSKLKKVSLIYLSSILLIIGIGFVTAWVVKPNFQLFAEGQYYAKTFIFLSCLLATSWR
ncbi:O-antigen ligase family protein [Anaerobacillus sp. CMMVII]|nr:O-antigen ligase family protein [Anaerobacillus sp. CMMVII]